MSEKASGFGDTGTESPHTVKEMVEAMRTQILNSQPADDVIQQLIRVNANDRKRVFQTIQSELLSLLTHSHGSETSSKKILRASDHFLKSGNPVGTLEFSQMKAMLETMKTLVNETGLFTPKSAWSSHIIEIICSPSIPSSTRLAAIDLAKSVVKTHEGFSIEVLERALHDPDSSSLLEVLSSIHQATIFGFLAKTATSMLCECCTLADSILTQGIRIQASAVKPFCQYLFAQMRYITDPLQLVSCICTSISLLPHVWSLLSEKQDLRLSVFSSFASVACKVESSRKSSSIRSISGDAKEIRVFFHGDDRVRSGSLTVLLDDSEQSRPSRSQTPNLSNTDSQHRPPMIRSSSTNEEASTGFRIQDVDAIEMALKKLFVTLYSLFPLDMIQIMTVCRDPTIQPQSLGSYLARNANDVTLHPFLFLELSAVQRKWKDLTPGQTLVEATSLVETSRGFDRSKSSSSSSEDSGFYMHLKQQIEDLKREVNSLKKNIRTVASGSCSPTIMKRASSSNSLTPLTSPAHGNRYRTLMHTELMLEKAQNAVFRDTIDRLKSELSTLSSLEEDPWGDTLQALAMQENQQQQWLIDKEQTLLHLERLEQENLALKSQIKAHANEDHADLTASLQREAEALRAENVLLQEKVKVMKDLDERQNQLEKHAAQLMAATIRLQQQQPIPIAIRRVKERYENLKLMMEELQDQLLVKEEVLRRELSTMGSALEAKDREISQLQSQLEEQRNEVSQYQNHLSETQEFSSKQISALSEQCDALQTTNNELELRILELMLQIPSDDVNTLQSSEES